MYKKDKIGMNIFSFSLTCLLLKKKKLKSLISFSKQVEQTFIFFFILETL